MDGEFPFLEVRSPDGREYIFSLKAAIASGNGKHQDEPIHTNTSLSRAIAL
jgi:hypothetical protein